MNRQELEVEVANARLDAAKAKADLADKEFSRAQALKPDNAISGSDYDKLECDQKVAQAELREAMAQVKIAELGLGK